MLGEAFVALQNTVIAQAAGLASLAGRQNRRAAQAGRALPDPGKKKTGNFGRGWGVSEMRAVQPQLTLQH